MESSLHTIEQVNSLDYIDFVLLLHNVVEDCPLCAAAVWKDRPFKSTLDLFEKICSFLDRLSDSSKEGILRLQPGLVRRVADSWASTRESREEQKSGELDSFTGEERTILQSHNFMYKEKFAFPYVICLRETQEPILNEIVRRRNNCAKEELDIAMEEVKKICRLRLLRLIAGELQ